MRVFYDTEFLEDGHTIELISIGMVTEDGREYSAVNSEAPWERILQHPWLRINVVPHLPGREPPYRLGNRWIWSLNTDARGVKPRGVIANEVQDFLLSVPQRQLWAWYAAYDHVALAQLWGPMARLPEGIPMWTNDIRQECERLGNPPMPEQTGPQHDALADARHVKVRADYLAALAAGAAGLTVPNDC